MEKEEEKDKKFEKEKEEAVLKGLMCGTCASKLFEEEKGEEKKEEHEKEGHGKKRLSKSGSSASVKE